MFRSTARRLTAAPLGGLNPRSMNILAPIPLYRRVLRANRKLEPNMRCLGDQYVKSEFRAHRTVDNPAHLIGFLTEWQLYAQKIEGDAWKEGHFDKMKLDKMSEQQVGQLYELKQTINVGEEGK